MTDDEVTAEYKRQKKARKEGITFRPSSAEQSKKESQAAGYRFKKNSYEVHSSPFKSKSKALHKAK